MEAAVQPNVNLHPKFWRRFYRANQLGNPVMTWNSYSIMNSRNCKCATTTLQKEIIISQTILTFSVWCTRPATTAAPATDCCSVPTYKRMSDGHIQHSNANLPLKIGQQRNLVGNGLESVAIQPQPMKSEEHKKRTQCRTPYRVSCTNENSSTGQRSILL